MASSPLHNVLLINRIAHFACSDIARAGKLCLVNTEFRDALQNWSPRLWKKFLLATQKKSLVYRGNNGNPNNDNDDADDDEERQQLNIDFVFRLLCTICDKKLTCLIRPLAVVSHFEAQQNRNVDLLNRSTLFGARPINIACARGSLDLVKELLEHGAVLNEKASSTTKSNAVMDPPLLDAVKSKNIELVKFLLNETPDDELVARAGVVDVTQANKMGVLPIVFACSQNDWESYEIAKLLIERGAFSKIADEAKRLELAERCWSIASQQRASRTLNLFDEVTHMPKD